MGADEAHRTDDARARDRRRAPPLPRARAPHRAGRRRYGGVEWINDSKSTNVASTLVALRGNAAAHRAAARRPAQGRAVHRARRRAAAHGEAGRRVRRGGAARRAGSRRRRARRAARLVVRRSAGARARRCRAPATRCCSRPPARATTCSTTTRSAAAPSSGSPPSSGAGDADGHGARARASGRTRSRRCASAGAWGPRRAASSLVTALLLAFGLAVLYSASAIVAMQERAQQLVLPRAAVERRARRDRGVRHRRQAAGGEVAASGRGRSCASRSSRCCSVSCSPSASRRASTGRKRFLFGSSFQPSEFGKLAVVVWTSMLIVKKGDAAPPPHEGRAAVLRRRSGCCDLLAALEPDLSVAMLYTLLLARAAVRRRRAHRALRLPRRAGDPAAVAADREGAVRACCASPRFLDPGRAPAQVSYQLNQSLIAVGSGGAVRSGIRAGTAAVRLPPVSVQRLHREQHRRGVGLHRPRRGDARLRRVRAARLPHRAPGAHRRSCSSWRSGSPSSPCSPRTCTSAS